MAPQRHQKLVEFAAHAGEVRCAKIGRKSNGVLVTGGEDKKVNLWAIGKTSALLSLTGLRSEVTSVTFDKQEEVVAAGGMSGSIKVFDLSQGKEVNSVNQHKSDVMSLDFHPYSSLVASGSMDTNVKVWDPRGKDAVRTFKGHTAGVKHTRFSPDGRWIATGSEDGCLKVWDLTAGKQLADLPKAHKGDICGLEFHPFEFLMASCGRDKCVRFWDLERFQEIGATQPEAAPLRGIAFHDEGRHIFAAGTDGLRVHSWEPCVLHDYVDVLWTRLADMVVLKYRGQQRVMGCSFHSTLVGVYYIGLRHVRPFCDDPEFMAHEMAGASADGLPGAVLPLQLPPVSAVGHAMPAQSRHPPRTSAGDGDLPLVGNLALGTGERVSAGLQRNRDASASGALDAAVRYNGGRPRSGGDDEASCGTSGRTAGMNGHGHGYSHHHNGLPERRAAMPAAVSGSSALQAVGRGAGDAHGSTASAGKRNSAAGVASDWGSSDEFPERVTPTKSHVAVVSASASSQPQAAASASTSAAVPQRPPSSRPTSGTSNAAESRPQMVSKSVGVGDSLLRGTEPGQLRNMLVPPSGRERVSSGHGRSGAAAGGLPLGRYPEPSIEVRIPSASSYNRYSDPPPGPSSHPAPDPYSHVQARGGGPYSSGDGHGGSGNGHRGSSQPRQQGGGLSSNGNHGLAQSEVDVLLALQPGHDPCRALLEQRLSTLKMVRSFLTKGNIQQALSVARRVGDVGVWADVLAVLKQHREVCFTLDTTADVMSLVDQVLSSPVARQVNVALDVVALHINAFGPIIRDTCSTVARVGVDLSFELRREKCTAVKLTLQNLGPKLGLLGRGSGGVRALDLAQQLATL